jgi:prepilin-type processing-associated H-X9-DG protein
MLSLPISGVKRKNGADNSMAIKANEIKSYSAFSLVELLVVISLISLLMAVLMPSLGAARAQARCVVCKSNLRQLLLANLGYTNENGGFFVPAASDLWDNSGHNRWHGKRDKLDDPFDPLKGPLAGYLGDGKIKECPAKVRFVQGPTWGSSFEKGCGGYGYNMTYVGSNLWRADFSSLDAWKRAYSETANIAEIKKPNQTLMFADTAMANNGNNLIEYSFAEPPFTVMNGNPITDFYMSPSIHFRHRNLTNIVWADGHTSSAEMAKFEQENAYLVTSAKLHLGWFDPIDNTPYDLK